jgi:four helix bundle protein
MQSCAVHSQLRVLDAARCVADEVNALLARRAPRLIQVKQMEDAANSIPYNIREGYGRMRGRDRNVFLRHARASAEELDEQFRTNAKGRRIDKNCYWRNHHRLRAIVKMLNALMGDGT